MNPIKKFEAEKKINIKLLGRNKKIKALARKFMFESLRNRYSYNFSWLGRPIIQYPQDIIALGELIWEVKPDLIIETGVAHGGSLVFSASMLQLLGKKGKVIGIDVDIRKHNRKLILNHPMFKRIILIEGSSVDQKVVGKVKRYAVGKKKILVYLDSDHSREHVLKELDIYSNLVSRGSYLVVFDTITEDMQREKIPTRPVGLANNPMAATRTFLKKNKNFVIDRGIDNKLLISVAPNGYLKRIK